MPAPRPADSLPPHSEEAESGALGCILLLCNLENYKATDQTDQVMAQADAMLAQLRPRQFYMVRTRTVFEAMTKLRMQGHVLNTFTLTQWLKDQGQMEMAGGWAAVDSLQDVCGSPWQFPNFLAVLQDKAHRRWLLQKGAELANLAGAEEVNLDDTKARLGELFDATQKVTSTRPLISFVTPKQAREFVPDPADALIGDGLIQRGAFHTLIGVAGCGKSRLLTTFAVCGARGSGKWLNYGVKRQFRTMILQTENTGQRLKEELAAVPEEFAESFKVACDMPQGMKFSDPEFRRYLLRLYDAEKFDALCIDPWNDVVAEDGASDFAEALDNIRITFTGRRMPAILIVAHMRKVRNDAAGGRKSGRDLLHEISGSLKLGSTSRTVLAVLPASPSIEDDRIVIEIAKANDVSPDFFRVHGARSAWHRRNAQFEPCKEFDWEEWDNPSTNNEERRAVTLDMVREVMGKRQGMKASELVRGIAEKFDKGESTVWRAIREGSGYLSKHLSHAAGVVAVNAKGGAK